MPSIRLLIALVLVLAAGQPLPARSGSPAPAATEPSPSHETAQAIAAVEARLETALAQRDRATLETIVAAGFTWVHAPDARVDSREVWLADTARRVALNEQRHVRSVHGPVLTVYGEDHGSAPTTAVRMVRVRLLDPAHGYERWIRQTRVFVRGTDGEWRLAWGQGTLMYEGRPLDAALHARYAGTYEIDSERVLTLRWKDEALFATFPNGAEGQIFLASPTEEAARTVGAGHLRFKLGPDRRPVTAALMRGDQELWRATRRPP